MIRSDAVETADCLAQRSRNQIDTSVQILQKATKGTKSQGKNCDSLFPLLPFVKIRVLTANGANGRESDSPQRH